MIILGLDLSGPTNVADTCLATLAVDGDGLSFVDCRADVGDNALLDLAQAHASGGPLVLGIDAPLSYNQGGGDRAADRALRRAAVAAGMRPGSIMPPTLTRMAYLTLRGVSLTRSLALLGAPDLRVVEVHPGAALALRGAPLAAVLSLKASLEARQTLLGWLRQQYVPDLPAFVDASDHLVMAVASAVAAFDWQRGASPWLWPAQPPHHPYDFVC